MRPASAIRKSRPRFLWQGLLILLPVGFLAVLGTVSLRRDFQQTRLEASVRSQGLASELSERLARLVEYQGFTTESAGENGPRRLIVRGEVLEFLQADGRLLPAFQWDDGPDQRRHPLMKNRRALGWDQAALDPIVRFANKPGGPQLAILDTNGGLLYPPPRESAPTPRPFRADALNERQGQAWRQLQTANADPALAASLIEAGQQFLNAEPPREFAAVAWYQLGLAQGQAGQLVAAREAFQRLLRERPFARTESGLPLAPLAAFHAARFQLASNPAPAGVSSALAQMAARAVLHPSPLTELLLARAEAWERETPDAARNASPVQGWREVWKTHEVSRQLWTALQDRSTGWVRLDQDWLVSRASASAQQILIGIPASVIEERLRELERNFSFLRPDWRVQWNLAGRRFEWNAPPREKAGERAATVADALEAESSVAMSVIGQPEGRAPFSVRVGLANPERYYAAARQRQRWFALLIVASAAVALVGFLGAYRAFQRQLRLNELKGNFVSSVSHELRAPLASVRLMAESLDRGAIRDEPKRAEYFRLIVRECRRLSSLIENVLDFSRIDQGRKAYEFEPTDLAALVRQTVQILEPYAIERGVRLELQDGIASAPLPVAPVLDGKAIQQALVNLIDNAIKHSPAGQTVTIGLDMDAPSTKPATGAVGSVVPPMLQLWVEDRGRGIPVEERERIFEPFYRLGSELRRETTGIGIGLSIVKHIVEAHGGRVRVRSGEGSGSRFTLELPGSGNGAETQVE